MTAPFLLVQLSDSHIGADWDGGGNPARLLAAAVDAVRAVRPGPDAVLVSGDLAEHASDAEYGQLRALLEPLGAPLYVLPGNHDEREALRRNFGLPGAGHEPVQYAQNLGPLRLVVVDSTRPGSDAGELDAGRLEWLDAELGAAPEAPTLVAMHHPPLATGIPAWDAIGLPEADRRALGRVVERHPQVRRIVSGHVHRATVGTLGGCPVLSVPSTYMQARLDFLSGGLELSSEPAAFAVHALVDGEFLSQIQPV
jgi:3',5'-cyclic-AMP phosphodiesterase